jgi:Uncharacterized protein conserved in bacteria
MKNFSAFTLRSNGRIREIHTDVQISEAISIAGLANNDSRLISSKALWDTGATNSSITASLAKKMGLKPVSFAKVHHAQGVNVVPVYLVNLYLNKQVAIEAMKVSEIADTVGKFDVLIGMDIITLGDFAVTNVDGKTCVSFRIPSIETIDYIQEIKEYKAKNAPLEERLKAGKKIVARNATCPCGSGKKYKHCHGQE